MSAIPTPLEQIKAWLDGTIYPEHETFTMSRGFAQGLVDEFDRTVDEFDRTNETSEIGSVTELDTGMEYPLAIVAVIAVAVFAGVMWLIGRLFG